MDGVIYAVYFFLAHILIGQGLNIAVSPQRIFQFRAPIPVTIGLILPAVIVLAFYFQWMNPWLIIPYILVMGLLGLIAILVAVIYIISNWNALYKSDDEDRNRWNTQASIVYFMVGLILLIAWLMMSHSFGFQSAPHT